MARALLLVEKTSYDLLEGGTSISIYSPYLWH
jgi:hypothetical protein